MLRRFMPLGMILLVLSAGVYADRVIPSDRVESRLRVRDSATAQSPIVGHLNRWETAELTDSVPFWILLSSSGSTVASGVLQQPSTTTAAPTRTTRLATNVAMTRPMGVSGP